MAFKVLKEHQESVRATATDRKPVAHYRRLLAQQELDLKEKEELLRQERELKAKIQNTEVKIEQCNAEIAKGKEGYCELWRAFHEFIHPILATSGLGSAEDVEEGIAFFRSIGVAEDELPSGSTPGQIWSFFGAPTTSGVAAESKQS